MKKIVMFTAKVFIFLQVFFILLFGLYVIGNGSGITGRFFWQRYDIVGLLLFILGIGGIFLGITIKINEFEKPEKNEARKRSSSIGTILLIGSPIILIIAFIVVVYVANQLATF